ncbi:MAG: phosphate/phosphite/phosphonate ABC transporter substrate-binding protein [Chloroflexi bacterium]|nr:MAG: phosphate/phosphite/phosphonate ABC transporter substrate-binding protein [Chloroflexota bacterium]
MIRTLPQTRRGLMRSNLRGPLGWALAAGLVFAAACSNQPATSGPTASAAKTPRIGGLDRPIQLAFTPSTQAATISTNGAAIKAALEKSTGLRMNVTVMTSYAAQVEAMCAGSVDMGFFAPLQMTLLLSKGCGTPVIGALRKDDTGQLSTTYKSQILVSVASGITDINGLKGKKFAFVDPLSASGYVYPTLVVKNKTGQEPKTFFSSTIFAGGHPQAALAVYQGTVDGAATFIDARDSLVATTPDIKTKTKVIDTAGPIPNDGVALAKNFPDDIAKQVKSALIDYSKADDGKKVFSALFSWDGMQEISPSFYDDMKTAAALAGVDVQGLANATPKPAPTTAAPSKSP